MLNPNYPKTEIPVSQSGGVLTPPFVLAAHQESAIDKTTDGIEQTKLAEINRELRSLAAATQSYPNNISYLRKF